MLRGSYFSFSKSANFNFKRGFFVKIQKLSVFVNQKVVSCAYNCNGKQIKMYSTCVASQCYALHIVIHLQLISYIYKRQHPTANKQTHNTYFTTLNMYFKCMWGCLLTQCPVFIWPHCYFNNQSHWYNESSNWATSVMWTASSVCTSLFTFFVTRGMHFNKFTQPHYTITSTEKRH